MCIDNEEFEKWMERLSRKLSDIDQDLKSLINTREMFDEDEKLLDRAFLPGRWNRESWIRMDSVHLIISHTRL
jgi:hypothetical protein